MPRSPHFLIVAAVFTISISFILISSAAMRNAIMLDLMRQSTAVSAPKIESAAYLSFPTLGTNVGKLAGYARLVAGDYLGALQMSDITRDAFVKDPSLLLAYYQEDLVRHGSNLRDTMAGNLLDQYSDLSSEDRFEEAAIVLRLVEILRPYDLFVNTERYRQIIYQTVNHNQAEMVTVQHRVEHFPLESVTSNAPLLRQWMHEAADTLLTEGVWDPVMYERLERFWRWQYLSNSDPIGREIADDRQSIRETHSLAESVELAAQLLQIDEYQITLGPELIHNSEMVHWFGQEPVGWSWSNMSGDSIFADALFVGGSDLIGSQDLGQSARIDGIWREDVHGPKGARAGYWYQEISLPPDVSWLIVITYKTSFECPKDEAASLLLEAENPEIFPESFLPTTNGEWRREALIIQNTTPEDVSIRPLIRNWAACTVWLDNFSVKDLMMGKSVFAESGNNYAATWELHPVILPNGGN